MTDPFFKVLLESAAMGFAIAAPVGPIGVLCIRRTLAHGVPHGIASGFGAATADAVYSSLVAFGLTAITALILDAGLLLNLIGGTFLLYLGITTLRSTISVAEGNVEPPPSQKGLLYSYASTLALTITNPLTIMVFIGIFAGLGNSVVAGGGRAGLIVLGVFLGSITWWLILSLGVGILRTRITPGILVWINRVSGLVICGFALHTLIGVIG
jgi:threonine/homoserine/homoserine lactone efflux protein